MLKKLVLILVIQLITFYSNAQLIINEFSNGPSGSKEFFELVTVGTPGTFVDIRGWIIDDHSGYFGCSSGNGIASGHIRLAVHSNWQCVPVGSIIVIYNPSDKNASITQLDDPTDSNNDGVYILPISSNPYIQAVSSSPSSSACNNFSGTYGASTSWSNIALGNSTDAAEVIDPTNTSAPYHAVGYGSLNGPLPAIYFSGSGSGSTYRFTNSVSNNWSLQSNWAKSSASSFDSPGSANNTANQNWLNSLKLQATANYTPGCAPVSVSFNSNAAGASGVTYSWNFDDGTTNGTTNAVSHTYTATGTYHAVLTITNANGCTNTDTVEINVTGVGVSAPAVTSVCENDQPVTLPSGTPTGGIWSGTGVQNGVFDPSQASIGNNQLIYTVSGTCGGSDTVLVAVNATPQASLTASDTALCSSAQVSTLTGSPVNGVYSGTGVSGSTFNPSGLNQGTYTASYTVTSTAGCADTASVNILVLPDVSISWSLQDTFCYSAGDVFVGGAMPTGGTYFYQGQALSNATIPTNQLNQHTSIQEVVYSVQNSGCTVSDTASFFMENDPEVTIQMSGDSIICEGEMTRLNAIGFGHLTWSTGETQQQIQPTVTGSYVATRTNFCGSTSASQFIEVIPNPTLTLSDDFVEICPNETAIVEAFSNVSPILWSTGNTGAQFSTNNTGTYTAQVSNACGTVTEQLVVSPDQIQTEIQAVDMGERAYQFSALSSSNWMYQWYFNQDSVSDLQNFDYLFENSKTVLVLLQAENEGGCIAYDSVYIEIESSGNVFIPNVFTPNGDGLNDLLMVLGDEPRIFDASVFNRWGEEVAHWTDFYGGWDGMYKGQLCSDGVYVLRVVYNDEEHLISLMLLSK